MSEAGSVVHSAEVSATTDVCRTWGLLQSLEFALSFHDVLVVPLDLDRLFEPPFEIFGSDLIVGGVSCFGGLKTPFGLQTRLVEGLAAPEQEADAIFELVVADNRIALQEPHGVPVPDLVLGVRQMLIDGLGEGVADPLVASRLRRVVSEDLLVNWHGVDSRTAVTSKDRFIQCLGDRRLTEQLRFVLRSSRRDYSY